MPTLVIANKIYSSWSLRPWLLLTELGIVFDEIVVPLQASRKPTPRILQHSPAGKVPILVDGDVTVWDSLAIVEYAAERWPDRGVWPADLAARALARSISAEMHSGFAALAVGLPDESRQAVRRDATAATGSRATPGASRRSGATRAPGSGDGGPFLFGRFTAADAMYAPVVIRLDGYGFDGRWR